MLERSRFEESHRLAVLRAKAYIQLIEEDWLRNHGSECEALAALASAILNEKEFDHLLVSCTEEMLTRMAEGSYVDDNEMAEEYLKKHFLVHLKFFVGISSELPPISDVHRKLGTRILMSRHAATIASWETTDSSSENENLAELGLQRSSLGILMHVFGGAKIKTISELREYGKQKGLPWSTAVMNTHAVSRVTFVDASNALLRAGFEPVFV